MCRFRLRQRKLTEQREGDDRDYLKGKADIHEASLSLQERVRRVYLEQGGARSLFLRDRMHRSGWGDACP